MVPLTHLLRHRRLPVVAALLATATVACWLGAALGWDAPLGVSRGLALAALLAGALLLLRLASRGPRWLLVLVAVAVVVRLAGIEHEVEERYYLDEGTYYHHATEINAGKVLRYSFVYPHFLYYADAFLLWLVGLFPGVWGAVAALLGVRQPVGVEWLALRVAAALFSAAAVVPVSLLARRLAKWVAPPEGAPPASTDLGMLAGGGAGILMTFSPLFNEGSHVNLSDGPSAVFAAFCLLYVGRLVEEERLRDYLWAGIFSGLAAATKYPAGVVAVAIGAVWLRGCWQRRRPTLYLLWAGLASLGTFLAVMPSLLVAPYQAFFGGRGIFFGVRQYSGGGWIGVMPTSNGAYYGGLIEDSFGPAAVILGGAGLLWALIPTLARSSSSRLLWILPFPVLYLALIVSMNMVVERNLYPALPPLAALFGVGVTVLGSVLLDRFALRPRVRRRWMVAFVALVVAWPVLSTAVQAVSFTRPSTRQIAARWIEGHLTPGSGIVKEAYTPHLRRDLFRQYQRRFVPRIPPEEIHDGRWEYLLLAGNAYGRFFNEAARTEAHHEVFAARYREMLAYPSVRDFEPGLLTRGPLLRLLRIPPTGEPAPQAVFGPGDAFVPDGSMAPAGAGKPLRYTLPGQWVLFKARLAAGTYRVEIRGQRADSSEDGTTSALRVVGLETELGLGVGDASGRLPLDWHGPGIATATLPLPQADKVFLYIYLPQGSRLRRVTVTPGTGAAIDNVEGSQSLEGGATGAAQIQ